MGRCSQHNLDLHARRGLDKTRLRELATARFIKDHLNILITGPTGVGKTYRACAIAHSACRNGFTARYLRLPRLLQDIVIARGDGSYPRFLVQLAKTDLIILDDWGLARIFHKKRGQALSNPL